MFESSLRMDYRITYKSIKNLPGQPMAPLGLIVASLGGLWGYPPHENTHTHTQISRKYVSEHDSFWKSDNVRKHSLGNCNQKITIAASLQCAGKTAGRQFTMVASLQEAERTALRKMAMAKPLQRADKTAIKTLATDASCSGLL